MKRWSYPLLSAILLFATAATSRHSPSLAAVFAAQDWLNGRETSRSAAGRVVVVDVFTVDCVNCRNVVPALRSLYREEHGRGLEIVGVHSPETPAEKQRPYVVENLSVQGIVWPVAVDNDFA